MILLKCFSYLDYFDQEMIFLFYCIRIMVSFKKRTKMSGSLKAQLSLLFLLLALSAHSEEKKSGFSFLPETHLGSHLKTFFLHKDSEFEEKYFIELSLHIDFALFSIGDRFFHKWDYRQITGMGKQDGIIIFDPRDASYHANAWFEYRFDNLIVQAGLEHPCYHQIDRSEIPSLYWNKIFIGLQSPTSFQYPGDIGSAERFIDRFSWNARWGFFLRKRGQNKNTPISAKTVTSTSELTLDLSYAAYTWRKMTVRVTGQSLLGGATDGTYWSQTFGTSVEFHNRILTGDLFVNYILDDVFWVLSRDKLLEVGIRIRK